MCMQKRKLRDFKEDLNVVHVSRRERLVSRFSTKGNQIKWRTGDKFVKLNCLGYENIAETLVSWFLHFTNIKEEDYVDYFSCMIYRMESVWV